MDIYSIPSLHVAQFFVHGLPLLFFSEYAENCEFYSKISNAIKYQWLFSIYVHMRHAGKIAEYINRFKLPSVI